MPASYQYSAFWKNLGNGCHARCSGQRRIPSALVSFARTCYSRQLGARNLALAERLAGFADSSGAREQPVVTTSCLAQRNEAEFDDAGLQRPDRTSRHGSTFRIVLVLSNQLDAGFGKDLCVQRTSGPCSSGSIECRGMSTVPAAFSEGGAARSSGECLSARRALPTRLAQGGYRQALTEGAETRDSGERPQGRRSLPAQFQFSRAL